MIERYTRPEMGQLWTDENRYKTWLEVEIAAVEAWAEKGTIPKVEAEKIRQKASFNVKRMGAIEKETNQDIVAFTRMVSESLGEERNWLRYGLTDTDVINTAYGYQLKQVNALLEKELNYFLTKLAGKAKKYQYTLMMKHMPSPQPEPTTFGLTLALWHAEMKRHIERFEYAAKGIEVGKISGAVSLMAHTPPEVETDVCEKLGIRVQERATQILPRDLYAEYLATLALIATSIEKFATEIEGLQESETQETEGFLAKSQKNPSDILEERDTIDFQNVKEIAQAIRGHMVTAYDEVVLGQEQALSHSLAKRTSLPDSTILLDYLLNHFSNTIEKLMVYPEKMEQAMKETDGLIYSQRVLSKLLDKGMSREKANDLVHSKIAISQESQIPFRDLIEGDTKIMSLLTLAELDDAFDYRYHLKNIDDLFNRVGL